MTMSQQLNLEAYRAELMKLSEGGKGTKRPLPDDLIPSDDNLEESDEELGMKKNMILSLSQKILKK